MKGPTRALIFVIAVVALIAVHTAPLYYLMTHKIVSAGVAAGVLALVLAKHLGLFRPLFAYVRGRFRKPDSQRE